MVVVIVWWGIHCSGHRSWFGCHTQRTFSTALCKELSS